MKTINKNLSGIWNVCCRVFYLLLLSSSLLVLMNTKRTLLIRIPTCSLSKARYVLGN